MRGVHTNGDHIRELRRAAALTQSELAFAAGCDPKTIRKAEKGEAPVDFQIVSDIARALKCQVAQLMRLATSTTSTRRRNERVVQEWHEAFARGDLEAILPLHTEDTIVEIPGTDDLPGAQTCRGIDEVRRHFDEVFRLFKLESVNENDFEIHAVDSIVFLRTTATFQFLPAGKSYTTRHVSEFEIRDGKIARRVTVADYGKLRELLEQ